MPAAVRFVARHPKHRCWAPIGNQREMHHRMHSWRTSPTSVPGEPGHDAQGPPIFQIVVLRLEAVVRRPAHARRFRREVVFVLGGTAPLVVQALGNFASSVRGALIRPFALRGVSQAIAQTAPEIAPAPYV